MWAYAQTSSQAAAIPWAAVSVREIRTIGDPVLRERAREVTTGEWRSPAVQALIDDMVATKRAARCRKRAGRSRSFLSIE